MRFIYLLYNFLIEFPRFARVARGKSAWKRQQQSVFYGMYQTVILDDWCISWITCQRWLWKL